MPAATTRPGQASSAFVCRAKVPPAASARHWSRVSHFIKAYSTNCVPRLPGSASISSSSGAAGCPAPQPFVDQLSLRTLKFYILWYAPPVYQKKKREKITYQDIY
ncbi:protein of unknown function [Aminobacter niigataensis]|nr:protein of unknown function [Aminobacter niigataensis]